jgi:hypothetical protein
MSCSNVCPLSSIVIALSSDVRTGRTLYDLIDELDDPCRADLFRNSGLGANSSSRCGRGGEDLATEATRGLVGPE